MTSRVREPRVTSHFDRYSTKGHCCRTVWERYNSCEDMRHMRSHRALGVPSAPRAFSLQRIAASVLFIVATIPACIAQSKVVYLGPTSKPVTMQDVIRLTKAGVSDDVIIEQLKSHNERFALTTDQILQLKTAKVGDRVIATMLNPAYKPVAPASGSKPVSSQPPTTSAKAITTPPPTTQPLAAGTSDAEIPQGIPTQLGIYVKVKDDWVALSPEIVTWKSGGIAKSVASGGIVKGDVNGFIDGSSSKVRVLNPLEFVIVVPEGIDITAYQLVRLHDHEDYREFRTVAGGVFHVTGGATRDVIPFEGVKVAPRIYHVTTSTALGEYGILPPGAFTSMNAASAGKIYSFGLVQNCGFTVPSCD